MGWSGSLTASSAVGSSITWTPDTPESVDLSTDWIYVNSYAGNYSVGSFTAPKRGVYKFVLKGSGGAQCTPEWNSDLEGSSVKTGCGEGGAGGTTTGYLLLEANQTVYIGAGGVCRAAFVSAANGSSLADIAKSNLYLVAGAGGSGSAYSDNVNETGYNCNPQVGGKGGGTTGEDGAEYGNATAGLGGTQSAGGAGGTSSTSGTAPAGTDGAYGLGGDGGSTGSISTYRTMGGRGGDGYYGGGGGAARSSSSSAIMAAGGGGSGYVKTASLTVMGTTYTSTTSQGGGAASNGAGSVVVSYYAKADTNVYFDGKLLTEIYFNGSRVEGLIYGGTRVFARRCREWLQRKLFAWHAVRCGA